MKSSWKFVITMSLLAGILFLGACGKKKVAVATPPPPPPPVAPTATLTASQSSIQKGQSVTLSWNTQNANNVVIAGLGTVDANGTRQVSPTDSTTYQLTAKGPGGSADASARVTVTNPPPVAQVSPTEAELFARNVKDLYFDYDKYDIRSSDQHTAEADAKFLAQHPDLKVVIEGHCDERGSEEYNLALGDNRANATKTLMDKLGISAERLKVISYGKERPFCSDSTDSCYQLNRRAHFAIAE